MTGDISTPAQRQTSPAPVIPMKERRRGGGPKPAADLSLQHYSMILLRRKWLVVAIFLVVSAGTIAVSYVLPNVYTSETLILVDPQQVPDRYVEPTVSGGIRNRLSTLSQQILSATRLQKIIDTFNLYTNERKKLAREEVITQMRKDITVEVVEDLAGKSRTPDKDLTAFRISYTGRDPKLVAQVTNELASLFIEENLKAREQMATGTSNFMDKELENTRKQLEEQEAKIRDFKLKHLGEMPEQQQSNIQILGQLQTRLQVISDSLNRAEQQKVYLQTLMASQPAEISTPQSAAQVNAEKPPADAPTPSEAKLTELLTRYGENHPDVRRLRKQVEIERQEQSRAQQHATTSVTSAAAERAQIVNLQNRSAAAQAAAALKAQLTSVEAETAEAKLTQQQLLKTISEYQQKLEGVPMREQEVAQVIRDYGMSKEHYQQLLEKKLSAEMATQLEIRQQGEKFTILDPAQVPEKPSKPNRLVINLVGCLAGLALGLAAALSTEFTGMSITAPQQIGAEVGVFVLGVVPEISTPYDIRRRKRWTWAGAASAVAVALSMGGYLLYHYRDHLF